MAQTPIKRAFVITFRDSLPVLTGFGFLGMAYGILMSSKGYGAVWSLLMSGLVFAAVCNLWRSRC